MTDVEVIAYFADDPSRTYQLLPWLPVLERLHARHPVALVMRDPASSDVLRGRTDLPVLVAETFAEITALYDVVDAKVAVYCNNSMLNFQSLLHGRLLHVHINHGESDKQSMASNNAKAYDRVFVAGDAAVERYASTLMEFDSSRMVRVGRPQLDRRPTPVLAPTDRRTVLYAPTWQGDAAYNDYTSLVVAGPAIARAVLALPNCRLVYRPHPQVVASATPAVSEAHLELLEILAEAAEADPEAGHQAVLTGDILAVIPDCDAMISDVSAVGLDWLYLRPERPIFLTDRHHDAERLRLEAPVSRCADVIDTARVEGLTGLLSARLEHDEHRAARLAMRQHYFGDIEVGQSGTRFLEEVSALVALRDRLLAGLDQGAANA